MATEPQYVASLSYGKDSIAMLHVITDVLHWKLDRIVTADVWATDTIPAELPPMVEFKDKADKIIKERWGIEVEHFRSKKTFQDVFYHVRQRGKYVGQITGFPMVGSPECNAELKRPVFEMIQKSVDGAVQYIGIACDEGERTKRHVEKSKEQKIRLPLVEAMWTEQMCMDWCKENDLLAPTYSISSRGGCWFCPNQTIETLRALRKDYPQLWKLLLEWDDDCPKRSHFKPNGRTVHDYDKRFQWEDDGYKPIGKQFRWEDIENPQTNIFQFLDGKDGTT